MKTRLVPSLLLPLLFLALAPAALASTTWFVDGVNGSDSNNCTSATTACKTIGHAISLASSRDSIMVAAATYTENLVVPVDLTINGAGATTTIVDGGAAGPVVAIQNASLIISGLTIRNGKSTQSGICKGHGGGICGAPGNSMTILDSIITGNSAVLGGGVYMLGFLAIGKTTISGNSAVQGGGGIYAGEVAVPTVLGNSTISGNVVTSGPGGGIDIGPANISNSTIAGNLANIGTSGIQGAGQGGGIYIRGGVVSLNNITIAGNKATASGANGAGIFAGQLMGSTTFVTTQNTIVANNIGDGNCAGNGTLTSDGYNLSNDNTCSFTGPGDLNDFDPKLGPLQNNGGPTETMALLPGSPAIDAGNPSGCRDGSLITADQRGAPRPDKEDTSGCDIGAFESQND
jgi:predicted outer membrane repeat protein